MYFDVEIGGEKAGRITMELAADVAPKTAGEFLRDLSAVQVTGCRLMSPPCSPGRKFSADRHR